MCPFHVKDRGIPVIAGGTKILKKARTNLARVLPSRLNIRLIFFNLMSETGERKEQTYTTIESGR